uniref:carboxymuconolactone decarboxylase family protein n=1 Tax=Nonomuraea pusilla TaxID=46177 RepID=UPI0006E3E02D|nr:carboxymuconolactone decarboxylase family protein [Nonomuraea pusilla]
MALRYVSPVRPQEATGLVAEVYAQLSRDFGMARMAVFLTMSPAQDVLAATWAMLRESLLAGKASRTGKEVVALGVSIANRCPFCVAAHATLLHATGDHDLAETIAAGGTPSDPWHADLLAWAASTRAPSTAALPAALPASGLPFPDAEAPEYVGTALAFHFINRIASALLTENLLPGNLQKSRLVRSAGGRALARTVRRPLTPGASLPLVAHLPVGPEPVWAEGTPVGAAYAALRAAGGAGGALLGQDARDVVLDAVAAWDGEHPPMGATWLSEPLAALPERDRPAARLALLVALAPYRVTDADVAAWRAAGPAVARGAGPGGGTDEDLVRLCAFGAVAATERAQALLHLTGRPARPAGDAAPSRTTGGPA